VLQEYDSTRVGGVFYMVCIQTCIALARCYLEDNKHAHTSQDNSAVAAGKPTHTQKYLLTSHKKHTARVPSNLQMRVMG